MTGLLMEFTTGAALVAGAKRLHEEGIGDLESFSPIPIPEIEPYLSHPVRGIPYAVLAAGLAGAIGGYAVQWFTVVDLPLRVGGFPLHSVPAFVPITFESMVLAAAVVAFGAVFIRSGLLRWWHPCDEVAGFERAGIDRFFLLASHLDSRREEACRRTVAVAAPIRIVVLPGAP